MAGEQIMQEQLSAAMQASAMGRRVLACAPGSARPQISGFSPQNRGTGGMLRVL
jgi:hypothetical protein